MSSPAWPAHTPESPDESSPLTPHPYDDISHNRASALLRLGLPNARNAADDLVDRLESDQGHTWAMEVTKGLPFTNIPIDVLGLLAGTLDLSTITQVKDAGKQLVKSATTRDLYLRGLTAYYLGIAAALAGHKSFITRTPPAELSQILIELASAAPAQWRTVFLDAAKQAGTVS